MRAKNNEQASGSSPKGPERFEDLGVTVWSTDHVPFSKGDENQEDVRKEIQDGIDGLGGGSEQYPARHAIYAGELPKGTDIENALFYNVSRWNKVNFCEPILRFERREAPLTPPNASEDYCRFYTWASRKQKFVCWTKQKSRARSRSYELEGIPSDMLKDAATVWYEVRKQLSSDSHEHMLELANRFGISVRLRASTKDMCHVAVKPLLDGIIASLHYQKAPTDLDDIAKRLRLRLMKHGEHEPVSNEKLKELISEPCEAILGEYPSFGRWSETIRISPRDDGCVAAEIELAPHAEEKVSMEIEIFAVEERDPDLKSLAAIIKAFTHQVKTT